MLLRSNRMSEAQSAAIGTWRLSVSTKRGQEHPIVALAADGTGIYQSPEGPLPVTATYDGDDVSFTAIHKTVMTDFSMRFRGTATGDKFDGAMVTVMGAHPITGERVG